jgi:hypothetical protein
VTTTGTFSGYWSSSGNARPIHHPATKAQRQGARVIGAPRFLSAQSIHDNRGQLIVKARITFANIRCLRFTHQSRGLMHRQTTQIMRLDTSEQLIQHGAQGVHIGARINAARISNELLWAHVLHGAHQLPSFSANSGCCIVNCNGARHAKVNDFHTAMAVNKNVRRLDIAMDIPLAMRECNGITRL